MEGLDGAQVPMPSGLMEEPGSAPGPTALSRYCQPCWQPSAQLPLLTGPLPTQRRVWPPPAGLMTQSTPLGPGLSALDRLDRRGKATASASGQTPRPPAQGKASLGRPGGSSRVGISTNVAGLQPSAGEVTLPAPSEIPPRDSHQKDDGAGVMGLRRRWSEGRAAAT